MSDINATTSGATQPSYDGSPVSGSTETDATTWTTVGGSSARSKSTIAQSDQSNKRVSHQARSPNLVPPGTHEGTDAATANFALNTEQKIKEENASSSTSATSDEDTTGTLGDNKNAIIFATGTELADLLQSLKQRYNLTDQQLKDMEYAFYNPARGSQEANALLTQYSVKETLTQTLTNKGFNLPEGWPDTDGYNYQLQFSVDQQFELLLAAKNLSSNDENAILTAYYHSGATVALNDNLKNILNELRNQANQGMPTGWLSDPDTEYFELKVNSTFLGAINDKFNDYSKKTPPPTQSDLDGVARALDILNGAPGTSRTDLNNISPILVSKAREIWNSALSETRETYTFPVWMPPPSAALPGVQNTVAFNAIKSAENLIAAATKYVTRMPQSPEKMMLISFLQLVSAALVNLKNELYNIEFSAAEQGIAMSHAQQEASEQKIKIRYKQLDEIRQKEIERRENEAKARKWGGIMKICMPIIAVVALAATIATAGTMGPAALALCLTVSTLSVVDAIGTASGHDLGVTATVMNAAANGLARMCGGSALAKAICQTSVLVAVTLVAGPRGAALKGLSTVMTFTTMLSSSETVKDWCEVGGADQKTTMIAEMTVAGACTVAGMGAALSSSAGSAKQMENLAGRMAGHIAELTETIDNPATGAAVRTFCKISRAFTQSGLDRLNASAVGADRMKYINGGIQLTRDLTAGMQVNNAVLQYNLDNAQADLARTRSKAQAADAQMENMVENLQAAVDLLQKLLTQLASWIGNVSNQNFQTFQTAEQIISTMS